MDSGLGSQLIGIGEVVRQAVAPVFLLSGVGVTLTLLTNRLARVVDRARSLERDESRTHESEMHELHGSLFTLKVRVHGFSATRSPSARFARCWCRWWL